MTDTTASQWEKFAAIVQEGGHVICAPDVFAALEQTAPLVASLGGIKIRVSPLAAPGMIYAVSRDAELPAGTWHHVSLPLRGTSPQDEGAPK